MTSGKEDYLKAIYIISEDHELVSNKELSDMLHVSPPSVSEMIMKLQKEGYVAVSYTHLTLPTNSRV